jgi:hypothetical protein
MQDPPRDEGAAQVVTEAREVLAVEVVRTQRSPQSKPGLCRPRRRRRRSKTRTRRETGESLASSLHLPNSPKSWSS